MAFQAQSIQLSSPAQSIAMSLAPAQTIAYSVAPVQSLVAAAPAEYAAEVVAPAALAQWADYSPQNVDLPDPILPEPDYKCYQPPQVPPGQTRYLKVDEAAQVKNLEQNFNDVRTAIRENNTHLQRNRTQITNINRNHNHLLRVITNENNYEHVNTAKIVRVADTHRQRIENVPGEKRQFRDFKQTQKVEQLGCRTNGVAVVNAPAQAAAVTVRAAPAITVAAVQPQIIAGPSRTSILAPSTPTQVRYLNGATTIRSQLL